MKLFEIYEHPTLGTKAVKVGFSWPGLFFTFFWAMVKKMWKIGVGVFVAYIVVISILSATMGDPEAANGFTSICGFIVSLIFGFKGNAIFANHLTNKGYKRIWSGEARNQDEALAIQMREHGLFEEAWVNRQRDSNPNMKLG